MDWEIVVQKFTSRKFLVALAAEVGLLVAMLRREWQATVADAIVRVGIVVGMILTALGYIRAEAAIDQARLDSEAEMEQAFNENDMVRPAEVEDIVDLDLGEEE